MPKKKPDFQQSLTRLEEIASSMEGHATSLEDAMALYKEGIELSMVLGKRLQDAEQEVALLHKNAQGLFEEQPFSLHCAINGET